MWRYCHSSPNVDGSGDATTVLTYAGCTLTPTRLYKRPAYTSSVRQLHLTHAKLHAMGVQGGEGLDEGVHKLRPSTAWTSSSSWPTPLFSSGPRILLNVAWKMAGALRMPWGTVTRSSTYTPQGVVNAQYGTASGCVAGAAKTQSRHRG
jgi:hypothetical protein